ncbi:MAG: proline--tRNA ligase [Pleurocapsa minor GSE-CHR-MK-17-07R]|jgi:prolyl-tRNA synthetase|nr:proline--tRNA ligase [Pleurocapsa minor GSE-CHR-MK 17-07R]
MANQALTNPAVDFSEWYNEIVYRADLADQSPVRGCIIIKPYGYELWEGIKNALDKRFKATGHVNAYFPLFIPKSYLDREAHHVEGFSPELAVVTIGGGKELEEPLVVRPTSETIIGESMAKWIQSYRDLPLLLNQWANVVRWEMRTRPFLRTTEFLWQEGHTAHATEAEAEAETLQMLDVYADVAINEAAIPVIKGRKTETEKFAGALRTYTIEAMMGDKKALQSGTSHNLGQNFARAFNIQYLDRGNQLQTCWTTSWGMSTRMVGAVVMTHGDEKGLRLPPRLAPIQVVIVPIFKTDEEQSLVMAAVDGLKRALLDADIRVHVDTREQQPGFKFNDWEMRGVPVRLEIGPRDVAGGTVVAGRRDMPGKEGKRFLKQENIAPQVRDLLTEIQASMLAQATTFRDANTFDVKTYDEFRGVIEQGGFARVWFAGSDADLTKIKQETAATHRCTPLEQPGGSGTCFFTGQPADSVAIFARAY